LDSPRSRPACRRALCAPEASAAATVQLVHGDLSHENVLISEGEAPGFIDFTPFWAPAEFAGAMFANWIGPRLGDVVVLDAFSDEPHFRQLLLRASIRMLLVVSELRGVEDWRTERRAAELVLSYVDR